MRSRRSLGRVATAFALLALLAACRGKLLATAHLDGPGSAEARFTSTGKKLVFWADTEGRWTGGKSSRMEIVYDVDVLVDGALVAHVTCDSADVSTSVCGTHTNFMGDHEADCELKLKCAIPKVPPGEALLRVRGRKGANVLEVRNMSLNVRED